jgi:hypothetical protein
MRMECQQAKDNELKIQSACGLDNTAEQLTIQETIRINLFLDFLYITYIFEAENISDYTKIFC